MPPVMMSTGLYLRQKQIYINMHIGSSHDGEAEKNPTRNHEVSGSIPGLAQWVKDLALP